MCEKVNGKATWRSPEEVDIIRDLRDGISTMSKFQSVITLEDMFKRNTKKYLGKEMGIGEVMKIIREGK